MAVILTEKSLSWLVHVHRMYNYLLPRQLLYSHLCSGKRDQGCLSFRFTGVANTHMKRRNIDVTSCQSIAINRTEWRAAITSKPIPQTDVVVSIAWEREVVSSCFKVNYCSCLSTHDFLWQAVLATYFVSP